jgi:hypothetical protein
VNGCIAPEQKGREINRVQDVVKWEVVGITILFFEGANDVGGDFDDFGVDGWGGGGSLEGYEVRCQAAAFLHCKR